MEVIRMTEIAPYEEIGRVDEVEIRRYPALKTASVEGLMENEAFWILFRYITGKNQVKKQIEMTAPVITAEKIEMTAPVITQPRMMSFVLPARFTNEEIPEPVDKRVQIREIPSREVAIIRFRGYAREKLVGDETQQLLNTLEKNGIETIGTPFLMQYNSPMVPGILRRNEVGVEIRWNKKKQG
jgi:effector-binding domain-containing protein